MILTQVTITSIQMIWKIVDEMHFLWSLHKSISDGQIKQWYILTVEMWDG